MAKTTKVTKKTSKTNSKVKASAKKTKLGFLTNKINFRSRKTQFIMTILVFALVGGAWFTYKSFAAAAITLIPGDFANVGSATITETNAGVKANKSVDELGSGGSITVATDLGNGASKLSEFLKSVSGQQVVVCALARSVDTSSTIRISLNGFGDNWNSAIKTTPNLPVNDYAKVCSDPILVSPGRIRPSISILNNVDSDKRRVNNVRVGYVTVEAVASAKNPTPTPAPAPAPTK